MQDEINQKNIQLTIKAAKLTEETLKKAIQAALRMMDKSKQTPKVGRNSLEKLTSRDGASNMIEIADRLPEFEKIAKQYQIRYSIQRDTVNPNRFQVFFKAGQADAMTAAFAAYTKTLTQKRERPSLLAALRKNVEKVKALTPSPERSHRIGGVER